MNRFVISSEEVAALAEGFGDGPGPTSPSPTDERPCADALRANRLRRRSSSAFQGGAFQEALQGLDSIHESFAVGLGAALSNLMKREMVVIAKGIQVLNCHDWSAALRNPRLEYAMRIRRVAGRCLFVFEGDWLREGLELMFGGARSTAEAVRRSDFSPVERVFAKRMAALACDAYARASASGAVKTVNCSCDEHQGGVYGFAMPNETLAAGRFHLSAGGIVGTAWIAIPAAVVGTISGRAGVAKGPDRPVPGQHATGST